MKRIRSKNLFWVACAALLLLASCGAKVEPEVRSITILINAPKAKVFEASSLIFIKGGFTISVANEGAGLLTTDFQTVTAGLREAFRLYPEKKAEEEQVEIQLGTSIIENGGRSTLTMVAKGRIWKKKRWQTYVFSDSFMDSVRNIGEQIKIQAESV